MEHKNPLKRWGNLKTLALVLPVLHAAALCGLLVILALKATGVSRHPVTLLEIMAVCLLTIHSGAAIRLWDAGVQAKKAEKEYASVCDLFSQLERRLDTELMHQGHPAYTKECIPTSEIKADGSYFGGDWMLKRKIVSFRDNWPEYACDHPRCDRLTMGVYCCDGCYHADASDSKTPVVHTDACNQRQTQDISL